MVSVKLYWTTITCRIQKLNSALQHQDEFLDAFLKEIKFGRIMGPFDQLQLANFHLLPLEVVPKSDDHNHKFIIPSVK